MSTSITDCLPLAKFSWSEAGATTTASMVRASSSAFAGASCCTTSITSTPGAASA
jgi:hypothetical protein